MHCSKSRPHRLQQRRHRTIRSHHHNNNSQHNNKLSTNQHHNIFEHHHRTHHRQPCKLTNRQQTPTNRRYTQHATGQGFTADLAILTPSFTTTKSGNKALTFPVVIDVTTGKLNAQPSYWKVTTQSGQTIKGNYSTGIPTAIGDADLDGHIEGLIPFADSNLLTNPDVAISKITLYTSFGYNTEIASWTFPTAIAVTDIPTK